MMTTRLFFRSLHWAGFPSRYSRSCYSGCKAASVSGLFHFHHFHVCQRESNLDTFAYLITDA
jgi:hypothetical protein